MVAVQRWDVYEHFGVSGVHVWVTVGSGGSGLSVVFMSPADGARLR